MNDLRKAAKMALEVLCVGDNEVLPYDYDKMVEQSIQSLRQALAKPLEDEVKEAYLDGLNSGIEAEREACAKVCEGFNDGFSLTAKELAEEIRARGVK